jgi:hypothetical protein
MGSTDLVQESLLGVFPSSCVTQHLSLLSIHYDIGQCDIQQHHNLCLTICVSEYLKGNKTNQIILCLANQNCLKDNMV